MKIKEWSWSCVFLGQDKFDYEPYQDKILDEIEFLINRGVTHFYNFYRNSFDALCAAAVDKFRQDYPQIKNVLVLPYKSQNGVALPDCFDEAAYLQDDNAPTRFAVRNAYRKLIRKMDFVIAGVARGFSSARGLYNFAKRALKSMHNVVTDKSQFWYEFSPIEIEQSIKEVEERIENDEEFRILFEEMLRRYEKDAKKRDMG